MRHRLDGRGPGAHPNATGHSKTKAEIRQELGLHRKAVERALKDVEQKKVNLDRK